ncbi:MAG: exo-alpha-sialidase, partial [Mariniphaga sp.]|nr:exo-alpha-sialidase [Mariniphaga sp.]
VKDRGLFGANDFYSFDGGENWEGELEGAGGANSGDPTTSIGMNGRYYVGYITTDLGQGISYSDDQGQSWTSVVISNTGSAWVLDKNHLWIDNSPNSSYEGNLYSAWTPLAGYGHPHKNEIELSRSTNNGESWSAPISISDDVNAGSHNQGVNINSGPNGEVYAIWAIYDSWPSDETAIGFSKSLDGGATFDTSIRIIENIRGIRTTETSKNMRVNSFPVLAVDISGGANNGNLYVVWSNIGEPGINTGTDIDVYMIKSSDQGETWSDPIKVNQDPSGLGKEHYFPWITCDPEKGTLSVIFYDDRNVSSTQCEVYCTNSFDAGETWEDFKVSDVAFTPAPIPGLAERYFGDYLGISARNGLIYPCWTDNRSGSAMTYVSPYEIITYPENLTADLTFETGQLDLNWFFEGAENFLYFNIYRDDEIIGNTEDTTYTDYLPDYGYYNYKVTAYYEGDEESVPAQVDVQWGDAHILVNTTEISETLQPGETSTQFFTILSIGELELEYLINPVVGSDKEHTRDYCPASGGCNEYISNIQLGNINNSSGCNEYADYTDISTIMNFDNSYEITVTNGCPDQQSQCGIWIDWNKNDDFTDDEPITVNDTPGNGPYTATIAPPAEAQLGITSMRIRITNMGIVNPCGTTPRGEVEDYSINLIDWIVITPLEGNIAPGDSTIIQVDFSAANIGFGTYYADLIISNNDPDLPQITIPVTLNFTDMYVDVYAEPEEICIGESAQLFADPTGGSGTYTYSWASDPEGFFSEDQNPLFTPILETTTFIVEVDDGQFQINGHVTVIARPLPDINLGNDTAICQGESLILEIIEGYKSYLWQDGSTNNTYTVTETGLYWVEVTNLFDCISTDSIEVTANPAPVVDLGIDTSICAHLIYILDAGNPGAAYLWSTGETTQIIETDSSGVGLGAKNIWVDVTNNYMCTSN